MEFAFGIMFMAGLVLVAWAGARFAEACVAAYRARRIVRDRWEGITNFTL